ncbi:MAG TPA: alpha-glucan family phosphorylase [Candidatus Acetothermia bacterium]|nr:alpha-glucan family phosphorylase [Candidatus Acetothermia bacterium]
MMENTCDPKLPERIQGLADLAYNLWWSWNPDARRLLRALDLQAYRESVHNPVRMLHMIAPEALSRAAQHEEFLSLYDRVMERFRAETQAPAGEFPPRPVAYFSAEFGVHVSLPVYAGGLGILAGDTLKEASDLALPLVGVGLIYSHGYVRQRIRDDGWQEEAHEPLDGSCHPLRPALDGAGNPLVIPVPPFDPPVYVGVRQAMVGRIPLYLLTTDLDQNQPWDRAISQDLYTSDLERRLRQEIVLGIGGMQALRALGITPAAVHLNEGHPAFASLERLATRVAEGMSWPEALTAVRETTIFTTHTPLRAGTDLFPFPLIERHLLPYCERFGIPRDAFLALGLDPSDPGAGFNMTAFAMRTSRATNGVSVRHAEVATKIWSGVRWDETPVAIRAITNGVHLPTWIEPLRVQALFDRYLGPDWRERPDDPAVWEGVERIPDDELWRVHEERKGALVAEIDGRARRRWQSGTTSAAGIVAAGTFLDPRILTVGFARRFTAYKRPTLLLHDLDRLRRLLTDPLRPVQVVFAGKAHPADLDGKRLIQQVYRLALDPRLAGRIAFVEEYDQHLAKYLVAGVDVWLNTPLPPLEASGTSGMKAAVNGVPVLSVLDGWWPEGYTGTNGWAFGGEEIEGDRTAADADALYRLLEEGVVPLYYDRGPDGIPHRFVRVMKEAIKTVAPRFSARRMMREYVELYSAALGPAAANEQPRTGSPREEP